MKHLQRWLVLVVCFTLVFSLAAVAAEDARFVKVIAYDVNIRAGAGTEQPIVGQADYGDTFEVVQVQNGWYQVRYGRELSGWIHVSLVREGSQFGTKNPTVDQVEATDDGVNVRGGASTAYEVITTISRGTTYPLLQTSGDWVQIRLPGERTGWVSRQWVSVTETKAQQIAEEEQHKGTVITEQVNVRADKSTAAAVLGTLALGEVIGVNAVEDGWAQVSYQGQSGYVKAEFLTLSGQQAPTAEPPVSVSAGPSLTLQGAQNIRSGPGTNFALVRTGAAGSTFPISGRAGNWYEIQLSDGKTGWVAGWLPQVNGPVEKVTEKQASLDNELRGKTIVIDPGHGGIDVGAVGRNSGVFEKDITLSLGRMLYNKLLTTGANVSMTRPDDRYLTLDERVALSTQQQADAFVSLHYNTHESSDLTGSMTFYYRENGTDHQLAQVVQQELVKSLGLPDLGVRYGDYYVLRENPQTAVLVETAFLTNAGDEEMANDPKRQEQAAEGIFRALVQYLTR